VIEIILNISFESQDLKESLASYTSLGDLHVIHIAATTDLRPTEKAEKLNLRVNYEGTLNLLEATKAYITRFSYISTVYSCGVKQGMISEKYSEMSDFDFRNPYEAIKQKTERELAQKCKEYGVDLQILRPAVVLGRLIDDPKYYVPKYNVIYAFAGFFYKLLSQGMDVPLNIAIHPEARIHMIPVDYVAKTIAKVYAMSDVSELNIVPSQGLNKDFTAMLMDVIGYKNYQFVDQPQPPRHDIEAMYQAKVAPSFGTYLLESAYQFDNTQLLDIMGEDSIPNLEDEYAQMIQFAKDQGFRGLE